jgi:ABC-type hemin transport system substrate-binding protein
VLEFVTVLASAAGVPEQGALLCERLRARLRHTAAAARAPASPRPPPPTPTPGAGPAAAAPRAAAAPARPLRVAVLCGLEPGSLRLAGLWVPEMVQLAGGAPAPGGPSPGEPHARAEWAALQRAAPQALVLCAPGEAAGDAAARAGALATLPGWWGLPAVRAGAVYVLDSSLIIDPGVNLIEGVELLAHLLAPHAHAPPPAALAAGAEAPRALRLTLHGGQRCRPRLLPNFFAPLQ